MARQIDKESSTALVKLIIFCTITGICTVVLGMTLSNGGFARRDHYKAMFSDVTASRSATRYALPGYESARSAAPTSSAATRPSSSSASIRTSR